MALRRRTKVLFSVVGVLFVCGAGFTYYTLAYVVGVIYRPAGSEQLGPYTIKSEVTEGFGHTGHRSTLYLRQPGRDYLVSHWFAGGEVSPRDPMKLIYARWCETEGDSNCGIFYFNGATRSELKIAPANQTFSTDSDRWSADGRSAMLDLNIGQEILFLDLDTGKAVSVKVGPNTERPPWRTARFAGWSPDSRLAAVEVTNHWQGAGDDAIFDVDLYQVAPATGAVTYVGSLHRQPQPTPQHHWARAENQNKAEPAYQLVLDGCYRKPASELLTVSAVPLKADLP